jgi:allantoate deiminase
VEVHAEQGPGLWNNGMRVAIVTAIAGRYQYSCRMLGRANHAGSTAMADRQDALAGTADAVLQLEALARDLLLDTVITVGRIGCLPNAINVIPGLAFFSIDFRSPHNDVLVEGDLRIRALLSDIAERRGLKVEIDQTEALRAEALDADLCARLRSAAIRSGFSEVPDTVSGALHDAAVMASHVPSAMLFVASKDGISHNRDEFSRIKDIAAAAEILWNMVNTDAA